MNIYEEFKAKKKEKYQELTNQIIEKCIEDSIMTVSRYDDEYEMLSNNQDIIKELNSIGLTVLFTKRKFFYKLKKEYDDCNYSIVIYIDKVGVKMNEVLRKQKITKEYKSTKGDE